MSGGVVPPPPVEPDTPLPLSATSGGLLPLEATSSTALRTPATSGTKLTITVQLAPTASVTPPRQVPPPTENASACAPAVPIDDTVTLPGPLLTSVSGSPASVLPTSVAANCSEFVPPDQASTGSVAVEPSPVSTTLFGELKAFDVMVTLSAALAEVGE